MKYITIIFGILTIIWADDRRYVWTYEYLTMKPGEVEFEHYLTFQGNDRFHSHKAVDVKHNLELEIGMNERFDVGIYQNFSQPQGESLHYDGYKIRMRYRLGEKGRYIMDPLLYFEYKSNMDFTSHVYEGKLILARDYGPWNIALNPVFETKNVSGTWKTEWRYNAGFSRRIYPLLSLGLEFSGNDQHQFIGPVISHGVNGLWVAVGSSIAITNISNGVNPFKIRMIMGIDL